MSNDVFVGTNGNDIFNGSDGKDTVKFAGNAAGYRIDTLADGRIQVVDIDHSDGDTGSDILTGIDKLRFADKTYSLSMTATPMGQTLIDPYGEAFSADITTLADGSYVVTWESTYRETSGRGIYAQHFNADGSPAGALNHVNTYKAGDQVTPAVAGFDDGGYVIVWSSNDGSEYGVYAQRFDATGNKVGNETLVYTYTSDLQWYPEVVTLKSGGYLVTWTSEGQDGDGGGAYAQCFDANGNQVGAEFRVNTYTTSWQSADAITALDDGGYVITWSSTGQDGSGEGIYAQRFAADGSQVGGETLINTHTDQNQFGSSITALDDGGYIIVWGSAWQGASFIGNIFAQRFDANGNQVGGETQVNTANSYKSSPVVAELVDGGYVITWGSDSQDGSDSGVYMQRFDASGNKIGSETLVNTWTQDNQSDPSITAMADGGFIITWTSMALGSSAFLDGVYAQRYDAEGNAWGGTKISGGVTDDTINGGSGNQMLLGLDGNDKLFGGSGNDSLDGGLGNDMLKGNAGHDTLIGGEGADTLIGGKGNDTYILNDADTVVENANGGLDTIKANFSYTLATHLENLYLSGTADIDGTGNDADNVIVGNSGNNILMGGVGNDTLEGGDGNDRLYGSYGSDTLRGGNGTDTYYVDGGDTVIETADSSSIDTVITLVSYALGDNVENLNLVGADNVNGIGNNAKNVITGNLGNNVLTGGAGNDTLNGSNGDDTLNGGDGVDFVSGGIGHDIFRCESALNPNLNLEVISDFSAADDRLQLDNVIFTKLGLGNLASNNFAANSSGVATDADDYIVYNTATGDLIYDSNGSAAGGDCLFAILMGNPTLTSNNIDII